VRPFKLPRTLNQTEGNIMKYYKIYEGLPVITEGCNRGNTDYEAGAKKFGISQEDIRILVTRLKASYSREPTSTLTVSELIYLMKDRGVTTSDFGIGIDKLQLGRIDHNKPYNIDNIEFVTQKGNLDERNERVATSDWTGKKISTPTGQFDSIVATADAYSVNVATIRNWCSSGKKEHQDFYAIGGYPEKVASRLKEDKKRFWAGDNISDYVDVDQLINEITPRFESVLRGLVIDIDNDPNSQGTARRLSKMYVRELMRGRYFPAPDSTAFPNDGEDRYSGMLVVRAELKSMCSHHHQTVSAIAYIGIIPGQKVIGLSKYARIAQWCARRGTLQEELCNDIAREIAKATESEDVAVYIQGTHGCMENRGVMAHSSLTQTTVLRGQFNNADVKAEFFENVKLQQQFAPR
jgi:GTP cyclohydrolase I